MVATARPLPNAPMLIAGREERAVAIVADLHLGLASGPENPLGPPGASAPELAEELLRLCDRGHARKLLVAGDVKHPVVGVPGWLRPVVFDLFSTLLAAGVIPEVVLGNHDVGLARYLPREVLVHASVGWSGAGVGVFHGHRWPSSSVLDQRTIIAGHLHPGFRFAPTAESPQDKRRCWVRVEFHDGPGLAHPDGRGAKTRELIVLPPFHPLAGVEALNRERPERNRSFLYHRFLERGRARAYLLDGTDLGPLPIPGATAPAGGDRPAPSAR